MKLRLLGALGLSAAGLVAGHPAAPTAPAVASVTPAAAVTPADCDTGAWHTDDISVQGRPDNFQPTDTYVWHDADGWHLRTSGANDAAHVFSGRVVLRGGAFSDLQKVRDESDDVVRQVGDTVYYRFVTYGGVDGFDFRVSGCTTSESETLAFHARYDGSLDRSKIVVGDQGRHPDSDPFYVTRSV